MKLITIIYVTIFSHTSLPPPPTLSHNYIPAHTHTQRETFHYHHSYNYQTDGCFLISDQVLYSFH